MLLNGIKLVALAIVPLVGLMVWDIGIVQSLIVLGIVTAATGWIMLVFFIGKKRGWLE